jgi:hypothetical protein
MRMLTPKSIALFVISALLLTGCASYKAGTGSPASTRTIWVAPVINKSYMPQISAIITERVRESFLADNEQLLARRNDADTHLEITITEMERSGRARGPTVVDVNDKNGVKTAKQVEDRGLYKSYDVILTARATLTDSKTGKVLMDREYLASTQTLPSPYTVTNADDERMLIPILARDLAKQIHDSIAFTWSDKSAK